MTMITDDPAANAIQRLEQAMDTANDLIGHLIRRLDDGAAVRPRLRVISGTTDEVEDGGPVAGPAPRLRVLD
jgi:hypothetical protein